MGLGPGPRVSAVLPPPAARVDPAQAYGNVRRGGPRNDRCVLWSRDGAGRILVNMSEHSGTCPNCTLGDLITITMTVGGRDLAFCTCHHCEAKWWFRDGEEVPLQSVIGLVVPK